MQDRREYELRRKITWGREKRYNFAKFQGRHFCECDMVEAWRKALQGKRTACINVEVGEGLWKSEEERMSGGRRGSSGGFDHLSSGDQSCNACCTPAGMCSAEWGGMCQASSEQGSDVMTDMCFKRRCLLAAVRVDCGGSAGRKVETQWRVTAKIQTRWWLGVGCLQGKNWDLTAFQVYFESRDRISW